MMTIMIRRNDEDQVVNDDDRDDDHSDDDDYHKNDDEEEQKHQLYMIVHLTWSVQITKNHRSLDITKYHQVYQEHIVLISPKSLCHPTVNIFHEG